MPKQFESPPMPADQRGWLHDNQSALVIEEVRPQGEKESGRVGEPPWLDLMLSIEGELFSEKKILGNQ